MIISDAAIKNRTTVFVFMLLIVVAGAVSYVNLPRESSPDVTLPMVMITTAHVGVAPEDIESTITNEIEQKLTGLKGMKEISSTSMEGLSLIQVEFESDVDIDDALQRVKDKVDLAKPELPSNTDEPVEPVVSEINFSEFPIMLINLSGRISPVRLKVIAEELEDTIEGVPGVLEVEVLGALEREIIVEMDPDRVAQYGLSIPEILETIPSQNVNQSAGGLETSGTKFNIRIQEEFQEPREIFQLPLATRNGRTIYLSDVATVKDTFKDRQTYSRLDGRPSITIAVKKRVGENVPRIAGFVKAILAEAEKELPTGVTVELTDDRSDEIAMMVSDLENNIISGLILVVLVLVAFMGLRSSMIVATAIPLSMLMSFAVLSALEVTLNMVVLFSLILALGMLVDNAIVIVENIYRHMELGYGRIEAAMKGTSEVAWPVIASTATTVAAFSPLLFWPDVMGDFMSYIPMTVITVLSCSLVVAMIINPVICSVFAKPSPHHRHEQASEGRFVRRYRVLLGAAIHNPGTTLLIAVLLLGSIAVLQFGVGAGVELFPETDPDMTVVNIRAPQGTHLDETNRIALEIERRLEELRYTPAGNMRIEHVVANIGSAGGFDFFSGSTGGSHTGNIQVIFPDYEDRVDADGDEWKSADVTQQIRRLVEDIPGADIKVESQQGGPPTGAPVTVRIIGEDMDKLGRLSDEVKQRIETVPGLVNLRSDLETEKPELIFEIDRQRAAKLGVNPAVVSNFIKTAIFGTKVSTYREFNDEYDIRIRVPESFRSELDDVMRLRVPSQFGPAVPLSSVGKLVYRPGYGNIYRIDRKRVVTVTADAEERLATEVLADAQARLDTLGPKQFASDDIKDPAALLAIMNGRGNAGHAALAEAVSEALGWWFLSGRDIRRLEGKASFSEKDRKAIAVELNKVLGSDELIAAVDPKNLDLGTQGNEFLKKGFDNLSDDERARLNVLILQTAWPEVLSTSPRLELPPNYRLEYAGEKEEQEESMAFLSKAFGFALLLIVAILVMQFNTLSAPLIIMTTVLLSTIGVFVGLLLFNMPFGVVMTGVGVISLAGVVVNNAIVLLDYTRQLQRRGHDLLSAATEAGVTRLRPVLLTATTTILGLIPMATGFSFNFETFEFVTRSSSSQWWSSMAWAVVFGLGFATVLTLVVVPALYVMLYRLASRFGWGGLERPHEEHLAGKPVLEDY
jgi:multidrug efflux pump subunit AcrB